MKMRAQEERMRALGLMEPTSAFALDEWEIPRDRVVINRKLGEGAFGTVYGGECFFDEKGWVNGIFQLKTVKNDKITVFCGSNNLNVIQKIEILFIYKMKMGLIV